MNRDFQVSTTPDEDGFYTISENGHCISCTANLTPEQVIANISQTTGLPPESIELLSETRPFHLYVYREDMEEEEEDMEEDMESQMTTKLKIDPTKQHTLSDETKTVTLRKCWSLIFDVNGNAPEDATVASFATQKLAKQALTLWANMKDNNQNFYIVHNGKKYTEPDTFCVEGYNWDTYYTTKEDWQEDKNILTSLAQLHTVCGSKEDTNEKDGIYIEKSEENEDGEDGEDGEESEDEEWSE